MTTVEHDMCSLAMHRPSLGSHAGPTLQSLKKKKKKGVPVLLLGGRSCPCILDIGCLPNTCPAGSFSLGQPLCSLIGIFREAEILNFDEVLFIHFLTYDQYFHGPRSLCHHRSPGCSLLEVF